MVGFDDVVDQFREVVPVSRLSVVRLDVGELFAHIVQIDSSLFTRYLEGGVPATTVIDIRCLENTGIGRYLTGKFSYRSLGIDGRVGHLEST